jgi:AcrR family transcriptional regulator
MNQTSNSAEQAGYDSDRPPVGADDSREKILRAAERIFAEKGLAGASVRAITSAAGVNHALIGYYFGSKVALYEEVLYRASTLMAKPRLAQLAALRDHYGEAPIPLRELMDAYIRSFFDDYGNPESLARTWLRFYGRCFSESEDEVRAATNRSGSPIRSAFLEEFQRSLPDYSMRDLVYRLGATIGMIAFWRAETGIMDDHFEDEEDRRIDVEELIEELISMSSAAFSVAPRNQKGPTGPRIERPKTVKSITEMAASGEAGSAAGRSRRHRRRAGEID